MFRLAKVSSYSSCYSCRSSWVQGTTAGDWLKRDFASGGVSPLWTLPMDGGDPDWATVSGPLPRAAGEGRESPASRPLPQAKPACGRLLETTLVCRPAHWKERAGGPEGNT